MPMETRKAAQRPQKRSFRAESERRAESNERVEESVKKRTRECENKSNTIP